MEAAVMRTLLTARSTEKVPEVESDSGRRLTTRDW